MAAFNKFNQFIEDLAKKVHNLDTDSLYILLTNNAPSASDTVVDTTTTPCTLKSTSNGAELAAGDGYTKGGGVAAFVSGAQSAGTYKLVLSNPATWTAITGTMGPFRYAVLYNGSAGSATQIHLLSHHSGRESRGLHHRVREPLHPAVSEHRLRSAHVKNFLLLVLALEGLVALVLLYLILKRGNSVPPTPGNAVTAIIKIGTISQK